MTSILLVSPAAPDTTLGNGVTARRWEHILRDLGHGVTTGEGYLPGRYDALVALHAGKSGAAVRAFHAENPGSPVVVALTGTDLYPDLASTGVDPEVLRLASRIVVLQANGVRQLEEELRPRARVIIQSVPPVRHVPVGGAEFPVAVLAHLRPVKDPLRAAAATRLLPEGSRVRVRHAGQALDPRLGAEAEAETAANPRYQWLGPLPRPQALDLLAGSKLLVLTSRHEGGANVVSEALAAGVPVVSSDIPGSTGLLGEDYPGYYPCGDTARLAALLAKLEADEDGSYRELTSRCERLRELVDPERERRAWAELLAELAAGDG
ncbi:selenoneine biosynthesis selenosugar synthase SenB [Amycolatopsis palatopharyngis]|uniref:selenoneine biosynthesis selenosugar synthase SenB n=1 Tax=Amycolatopsis palatopharyngis TaxID=187982 RepID=UPI001FE8E47C|nr:selenoneine biosynthesis selenosugar synthase SenB [Amycolatopsis palatopharyngis]